MIKFPLFIYKRSKFMHVNQDLQSRQHCKSELLTYAGRRFLMKLEVSWESDPESHSHQDELKKMWTTSMCDMMDSRGDFPSRSHPISRW